MNNSDELNNPERSGMVRLRSLKKNLDLWFHLVVFEIKKTHEGSALGLAWSVLQPLLFLVTYYLLFAVIVRVEYKGPGGPSGRALMMFAGLVPWFFFANALSRGLNLLSSHRQLIKQINFPIHILPFVTIGHVAAEFIVGLILMLLLTWAVGLASFANLLVIPVALLFAIFLAGLSAVSSCYAIMLPDLQKLIPTLLRVGIFLTPVVYSPADMSKKIKVLMYMNPIAYFISPFRYAVFKHEEFFVLGFFQDLGICAVLTAASLILAYMHKDYLKNTVVDYI